ncbi:MAG: hypothetical protein ABIL44_00875 [candidate division WOR-3 bacterium]
MVKFRAEEYLWLFKGIYKRIDDALDKERLAIAIMQEMAKDMRMEVIKQEKEQTRIEKAKEPATVKQINYLRILGVSVNEELTKQKAAELIDMAKMNNHKNGFKFKR